jgi:hypothetical protein
LVSPKATRLIQPQTPFIDEARKLAGINHHARSSRSSSLIALVVWEGASRGADDSNKFAELAQDSGFRVERVLTLNNVRSNNYWPHYSQARREASSPVAN